MAASDPTTDVATPTGVLQGCAAFAYSAGAWTPPGAGPSVATPTGVLRGIAPFTGGTPWAPAGLAAPSVATPTGALDGVAVYTWSGSAWTPPGDDTTPTPTGALRGVAAFNWDGTTWQPAGQAGPTVPTPFGVLDGVAMFNWNGTAWAAGSAAPGATVDLNFVTMSSLDPSVTLTRASTGTYYNSAGVLQTAAANAARFDYDPNTLAARGLLIEETRTNQVNMSVFDATHWVFTNTVLTPNAAVAPDGTSTAGLLVDNATSAGHNTNASQNYTFTSGVTYSFSFYAKAASAHVVQINTSSAPFGTVPYANFDLSAGVVGTTGGSAIASIQNAGNGWYRCMMVATATASVAGNQFNLALTNNNTSATRGIAYVGTGTGVYLWGTQLEAGGYPSSYIATTASGAVTRAADVATIASLPGRVATGESFAAEFMLAGVNASANPRVVGDSASQLGPLFVQTARTGATTDLVGTVATANTLTLGAVAKVAANWATPNAGRVCLNAGAVVGATTLTTGFAAMTAPRLMGDSVATDAATGWIRRFRYWPRVLADTELQSVTT